MSWCTIESDPGVFTELIRKFGVKGAHFCEFYSLDDDSFRAHQPLYGLVFLFRWQKGSGAPPSGEDGGPRLYDGTGEVYFANQVINNACGTQALIHILLNCDDKLDIGDMLRDFKSFTAFFPSNLAGEALNDQPAIRTAHNSFARPEPFVYEKQAATEDDDVYHFVAYVPVGNKVFELDGLQKSPVLLGEVEAGGEWFKLAKEAISRRFSQTEMSELRWALMGLCQDESFKLSQARAQLAAVERAIAGSDVASGKQEEGDVDMSVPDGFEVAASPEGREQQKAGLEAKIRALQPAVEAEKDTFARWKRENIRRKQNYIPLAVELLSVLADKKLLMPMFEAGERKAKEARERAVKRKADREAAKKAATTAAGADTGGSGADAGAQ